MMGAADIQALEPQGRSYKVGMGKGMYLLIRPNGSKYWRLKYRYGGKENTLSLGVFPEISIEEALEARDLARKQLRQGVKPQRLKPPQIDTGDTSLFINAAFSLSVSLNGDLSIRAGNKRITLSSKQADALKAFLNALNIGDSNEADPHQVPKRKAKRKGL